MSEGGGGGALVMARRFEGSVPSSVQYNIGPNYGGIGEQANNVSSYKGQSHVYSEIPCIVLCYLFSSTYSTLYNHPTRITEHRATNLPNGGKIKLSRKTGIPLGVLPGLLPKENHPSRGEPQQKNLRPRSGCQLLIRR